MSEHIGSEVERHNLEVHVDLSKQRHSALAENVEKIDERVSQLSADLSDFRQLHIESMALLKETHSESIRQLRDEHNENLQSSNKIFVGAAATIVASIIALIIAALF